MAIFGASVDTARPENDSASNINNRINYSVVLSSQQMHCKSSWDSFEECRTVPSSNSYHLLLLLNRKLIIILQSHNGQESLANAKGSAQQPWYIVRKSPNRPPFRIAQQHQCNVYIVEKYFQCATIPSLTLWVYLHSFSRCSHSNMPTSAKFRENLNVLQFKVIEGR